jgi:hypothetical protein
MDVTAPGDLIVLVNGQNDGDGSAGAPPANEGVEHALDDIGQKYLNFLDLNSGFAVQPQLGSTIITSARFFTANDAAERDPASVTIQGTNDPLVDGISENWVNIVADQALALPAERNPAASDMATLVAGGFFDTINFANGSPYTAYRVTFPTLKDAGTANSMQIGEVELIGTTSVPEPSSVVLVVLGLAGMAGLAWRRRRRRV